MSEKITVYEKPTCTTCRKLNKLFEDNGIDYEKVNYFVEPLTEEKLRDLLRKANLAPFDVLRKKEPVYKELNITEEMSPGKIIDLILDNPNLLQRPIVEMGDKAILARPVEKIIEFIKPEK